MEAEDTMQSLQICRPCGSSDQRTVLTRWAAPCYSFSRSYCQTVDSLHVSITGRCCLCVSLTCNVNIGVFTQEKFLFPSHIPDWALTETEIGSTSNTVLYCVALFFTEYSVVSKEKYSYSEVIISCV